MSRTFFSKAASGMVLVSGEIIKNIQTALNTKLGASITVDGIYGGDTTAAVTQLQTAQALPMTGNVDDATWQILNNSPEPDIFGRCLQVTASFEGTQFTGVTGNFDGAGITWGIVGFTLLKGGDLSAILKDIDTAYPTLIDTAFGPDAAQLRSITSPATSESAKEAWADQISSGAKKANVVEPWLSHFRTLGEYPQVQQLQVQRARNDYWSTAKGNLTSLGLSDELDYMLMFDTAVQNGGMSASMLAAAKARIAAAVPANAAARRTIIANVVASSADPDYVADVTSRKMAIATGKGPVHGGVYDLSYWGLIDGAVPTTA